MKTLDEQIKYVKKKIVSEESEAEDIMTAWTYREKIYVDNGTLDDPKRAAYINDLKKWNTDRAERHTDKALMFKSILASLEELKNSNR
jgi:hypothetical protein